MPEYRIPFNKPCLTGSEMLYVANAIILGHSAGDGSYSRACHAFLERELGVAKALLTTSCTHALELAALLLEIQPGDEVIVPSFTFVSTINAFVLRGAQPVFSDIRPDTLNMDERLLEPLITPRTRAIVPVHYAGIGCEMDTILEIARRHGIAVVEDNAHGLFARYKGRHLGTFGALATQSFHETKNITCGEGGALLINDASYIARAEILRDKGTNRKQFLRGEVDKYTWVEVGSSYPPSDILAAFLFAQLEKRDEILKRRAAVWNFYDRHLAGWAETHGIKRPTIPDTCEQAYHMYYLLMPSLDARQRLIEHLGRHGILGVFHYTPLHTSALGQRLGGRQGQCPITESVSDRLLRLPFYNSLTTDEQSSVVETILAFDCRGPFHVPRRSRSFNSPQTRGDFGGPARIQMRGVRGGDAQPVSRGS
jgi:dTDP-4-amino-4,6-dideoxygalactose transaminase